MPLFSFAARHADALLTHLSDSSLFLLFMLIVGSLARRHLTAGARFLLALIGILKFAVPSAPIAGFVADQLMTGTAGGALEVPLQMLGGAIRVSYRTPAVSMWPSIFIFVWLAVAACLVAVFAVTRHRLLALSIRTAVPALPREVEALTRARARVGVRRSIDIARSALPEAPAVLRIVRPLVVLPAGGCDELSDEELEALLCHECAHVKRHDNLIARIESLICALFWFHPLIWLAQRITVIERERACDEVVAGSADERDTYLTALTKFCHAAIAPRLPGVSCMATAKLKERIDHVMEYSTLKEQAPSTKKVAIAAAATLVLFTLISGIAGSDPLFASPNSADQRRYAIRVTATRTGQTVTVVGDVTDNKTQEVVAAPKVTLNADGRGTARTVANAFEVLFEVAPASDDLLHVDVTIEHDGREVQRDSLKVWPASASVTSSPKYSGDVISLSLKDADLRDVIGTFGKLTGLTMKMDDSINGKVTVSWRDVPWDQAFDSLLQEHGLTYRLEGSTMHISRK